MISEKTVELNLSAELLSWFSYRSGKTHYIIAPSQRAEGKVGFDAGFYGPGRAVLIQFKRAYVAGTEWRWHLNRTKLQDQHLRLQRLESNGTAVYYAVPHFHLPAEVAAWRRKLLLRTYWIRPSVLQLPGGSIGEHDIIFDESTQRWSVSSPSPLGLNPPDTSWEQLESSIQDPRRRTELSLVLRSVNHALFEYSDGIPSEQVTTRAEDLGDLVEGIIALTALDS
jgi:hypothetical protein